MMRIFWLRVILWIIREIQISLDIDFASSLGQAITWYRSREKADRVRARRYNRYGSCTNLLPEWFLNSIGSYTFAKTLEYKAKHNLHSGKNVTVIPPAEYQERFVNALEDYFLACPGTLV